MKWIRLPMYLLYQFYKRGPYERLPHVHMLFSMSILTWMNIVTVLGVIGWQQRFFASLANTFLLFGGLLVVYAFIGGYRTITGLAYSPEARSRGNSWLFIYITASMGLLFFSFTL